MIDLSTDREKLFIIARALEDWDALRHVPQMVQVEYEDASERSRTMGLRTDEQYFEWELLDAMNGMFSLEFTRALINYAIDQYLYDVFRESDYWQWRSAMIDYVYSLTDDDCHSLLHRLGRCPMYHPSFAEGDTDPIECTSRTKEQDQVAYQTFMAELDAAIRPQPIVGPPNKPRSAKHSDLE